MENRKIAASQWWESLSFEEQGILWSTRLSKFENDDQYIQLLFDECYPETSKDTDTKSEFKQKRISLTHGSARVDENCPQGTIDALNKISEIAYNSPSPTSEYKEGSEITNYYPLFQHLHEEHGLILLDSEMQEIVSKFPALSQLEAVKREKEAIYRQAYFDGLSGYPVDSEWYNSAKDIALSKHQSQSPISIPKDIEINPE